MCEPPAAPSDNQAPSGRIGDPDFARLRLSAGRSVQPGGPSGGRPSGQGATIWWWMIHPHLEPAGSWSRRSPLCQTPEKGPRRFLRRRNLSTFAVIGLGSDIHDAGIRPATTVGGVVRVAVSNVDRVVVRVTVGRVEIGWSPGGWPLLVVDVIGPVAAVHEVGALAAVDVVSAGITLKPVVAGPSTDVVVADVADDLGVTAGQRSPIVGSGEEEPMVLLVLVVRLAVVAARAIPVAIRIAAGRQCRPKASGTRESANNDEHGNHSRPASELRTEDHRASTPWVACTDSPNGMHLKVTPRMLPAGTGNSTGNTSPSPTSTVKGSLDVSP